MLQPMKGKQSGSIKWITTYTGCPPRWPTPPTTSTRSPSTATIRCLWTKTSRSECIIYCLIPMMECSSPTTNGTTSRYRPITQQTLFSSTSLPGCGCSPTSIHPSWFNLSSSIQGQQPCTSSPSLPMFLRPLAITSVWSSQPMMIIKVDFSPMIWVRPSTPILPSIWVVMNLSTEQWYLMIGSNVNSLQEIRMLLHRFQQPFRFPSPRPSLPTLKSN